MNYYNIYNYKRETNVRTKIPNIYNKIPNDGDDHSESKIPAAGMNCLSRTYEQRIKKNWCPRACPGECERLCKMATSPAGFDMCVRNSLVFDMSSLRRGGVGEGFTAAQSTGG